MQNIKLKFIELKREESASFQRARHYFHGDTGQPSQSAALERLKLRKRLMRFLDGLGKIELQELCRELGLEPAQQIWQDEAGLRRFLAQCPLPDRKPDV